MTAGEPVYTLYTETPDRFGAALTTLDGSWRLGEPVTRPLIIDRITR